MAQSYFGDCGDRENTRQAYLYAVDDIQAEPPGIARCSCGRAAEVVTATDQGPPHHTTVLETVCGYEDHDPSGGRVPETLIWFVAGQGEWVKS